MFATVVSVLVVMAVLQVTATVFTGGIALGQSSPSPSSGFSIQFLNPSKGTSNELSTKSDGTDTKYHIVAWVNKVPDNATVEFKYTANGSTTDVSLGSGTLVGSDTYEAYSDLPGVGPEATNSNTGAPNNSGTLKAILFSGSTEVARDEEAVRVNQEAASECPGSTANPPPCFAESQANTVELTYPGNGGALGYYRPNPGNGPNNSVFDVTVSTATQGQRGTGTQDVIPYYTLSPPGVEPEWKRCLSGTANATETTAQAANGVRCEYASSDSPSSVTAVAVTANDSDESLNPDPAADEDSSDAHRVGLYEQDATSVALSPQTATQNASGSTFACAPVVTATIADQTGRKIADMNVDVHATGPSDNLFFDDSSGTETSANKPPENHAAEGTANCEGTPSGGNGDSSQGDHEFPGEGDIKHIESSADTDDGGQFRFRLFSTVGGGTQFTVWADEDSNDRLCSQEAQGDGSIGWGEGAPGPTGLADEDTVCPRPGPTGSPSGSPSSSRSSSPSPSGTSTAPPRESRTATLAASDSRKTAGGTVTLAGQLFANDDACEDDEFIRITRRVHGSPSAEQFETTRTDTNGRYQATIKVTKSADYQVTAPAHDNCGDAFSSPVSIVVPVRVAISTNEAKPQSGDTVRIRVRVRPQHDRTKVVLQRRKGGGFVRLDAATLNRRSEAVFVVKVTWVGRRIFRASWKSQDQEHESGKSDRLVIRGR